MAQAALTQMENLEPCRLSFLLCAVMVLIYSTHISPRLQYTCSFIFKELLQSEAVLTNDPERFRQYQGIKINYSATGIAGNECWMVPATLLFEKGVKDQQINCFYTNGYKAFFQSPAGDFDFDIFSAVFYLLSRYEEYLPHKKDMYGRYAHENSLAFKEGFLNQPMINTWVGDFAKMLKGKFPSFTLPHSSFSFLPTYDIDIAYSYKHKGLKRTAGGFLQSPGVERIKVLAGAKKDPYDSYDWMDALHRKYALSPIYFFLVAEKNGAYDKNILPSTAAMQQLIQSHAHKYPVGIHPGWQSGDSDLLLAAEKKLLENISGNIITRSRQHYIRFNLPEGYRRLIAVGITDDYSMGYGSINGFRASVASAFFWYDLEKEEQTSLRIHPFCFMEANSFYEQHFSAEQAYEEVIHYQAVCKKVGGTFICIWHNNFLGTGKAFSGWRNVYEKFIQQADPAA